MPPHDGPIAETIVSPDGGILAVRTDMGAVIANVRLWRAGTGFAIAPPLTNPGEVRCFAFHPDGKSILTAGKGGAARFWGTARAAPEGLRLHHGGDVRTAMSIPTYAKRLNGNYLITLTTVQDDGATDVLIGAGGKNLLVAARPVDAIVKAGKKDVLFAI